MSTNSQQIHNFCMMFNSTVDMLFHYMFIKCSNTADILDPLIDAMWEVKVTYYVVKMHIDQLDFVLAYENPPVSSTQLTPEYNLLLAAVEGLYIQLYPRKTWENVNQHIFLERKSFSMN